MNNRRSLPVKSSIWQNEMNFMPPLCTYRLNWPGEPSEDSAMSEMTLPSRHRIRNSNPGGLRLSTLLDHGAPHNTEFYEWMGKKHFCFFQTAETGKRAPNSSSGANYYTRGPAQELEESRSSIIITNHHHILWLKRIHVLRLLILHTDR